MKRLINKLFDKLGYVPKSKYEVAYNIIKCYELHDVGITNGTAIYKIIEHTLSFGVYEWCEHTRDFRLIKKFYYKDSDSQSYARICAEELCEMLNQET